MTASFTSINPDIILLQEVRDYDACTRLGEAIAPGVYHVAICSAFREPFHSGLGRQQVAIPSKYQAQAAWSEPWKSMNGVHPPRGFAFAWFKIGNEDIGVYSVHLKSNLITHGDKEAETAKNRDLGGAACVCTAWPSGSLRDLRLRKKKPDHSWSFNRV